MQKLEIAREILAYLIEHPDAQDTLDGIIQWWLLERKIKYESEMVKEILSELVNKGLLLEPGNSSSRVRYRINKDRFREIQAMLHEK